jgi:hypothetical protein
MSMARICCCFLQGWITEFHDQIRETELRSKTETSSERTYVVESEYIRYETTYRMYTVHVPVYLS